MKAYIAIILGILLIAVVGCTPEQRTKALELVGQHRCQAYSGYLCSAPDDCGLPYLDTIESYCCPLNCQTCNQSCDDGNVCTKDICSKETSYACEYEEIPLCYNGSNNVHIDLFVMSMCPFGREVENELKPVLDKFGNNVKFNLNFIGTGNSRYTFKSLYEQPAIDEDIRQLCAMKISPENYMDYIVCQNKELRDASSNWEKCAKEVNIDSTALNICFEGKEGETLLAKSFAWAESLNVKSSPTIFINGEQYNGKRTSEGFESVIYEKLSFNFTSSPFESEEAKVIIPEEVADTEVEQIEGIIITHNLKKFKRSEDMYEICQDIKIENNLERDVVLGSGCSWPISKYNQGDCLGWALRNSEDYPAFTYKYVKAKSQVGGWICGVNLNTLDSYDTTIIKFTMDIDGKTLKIVKDVSNITE
ncbi:MAG: DsbA family protein [Nanoarchaeota archaeon]|nr:DsbA family protein [Nanoarchaeota archaeon]